MGNRGKASQLTCEAERLLCNVRDSCFALGGISQRKFHYLIAEGEIRPRRIGRRVFVEVSELRRFARRDHPTKKAARNGGNLHGDH